MPDRQSRAKYGSENPKTSYNLGQMGVAYCPRCQGNAAHAAGQSYCPRCGWNRLVAAHQIRSLQKFLPVLFLPFVAFGLLMAARTNQWETFLVVVIVAGALLYWGLRALRRSLARVEGINPVLEPKSQPEAFSLDIDEFGRQTKALLSMQRPRRVRLTSTGRVYFGLAAGLVSVLELILLWNLVSPLLPGEPGARTSATTWSLVAGAVVCLLLLGAIPQYLSRQKNLVMNGEIGLAKVIRQWRVRGNSFIAYELDSLGTKLSREALDCTHRLYREMVVPVFYDPGQPTRQIACCAAYYEVVFPDSK